MPALPDQALLGPVHGRDHAGRLRRAGERGEGLSHRPLRRGEGRNRGRHAGGVGSARFRTRGGLSRPAFRAQPRAEPPGHQSANAAGGGCLRHPPGGWAELHRSVLLPHRAELGQPRLFPEGRFLARGGGGAGRVPGAVLRRQAGATRGALVACGRGTGAAGGGAERQGRAQGDGERAAAGRKEGPRRPRGPERARSARTPAGGDILAGAASQGAGGDLRARKRAAPHRGLRQLAHHGHERGRRDDRRRPRRVREEPVPEVQHPLDRNYAR